MQDHDALNVCMVAGRLDHRGRNTYTLTLARALKALGFSVELVCGPGPMCGEFEAAGIPLTIVETLGAPTRDLFLVRRLAARVRRLAPDLLHVQDHSLADIGARLAKAVETPYVLTVQAMAADAQRVRHARKWLAGLVALSEGVREQIVNASRIPRRLVSVVHPGIDVGRFEPRPSGAHPGAEPVIATVGILEADGGVEYFLSAAREILDAGRAARFLVIGEGPDSGTFLQKAEALGLGRELLFIDDYSRYESVLTSIDIFVFPALYGGLGTTILEAMACARPVVVSAASGTVHLVRDGENGFLVPRQNAGAIRDRVLSLLDDPACAGRVGEAARSHVEGGFRDERMARETADVYRRALEERTVSTTRE